tara:strand:+ start:234 stop:677 length:444 start_codon:yes stop_codon:yes gene_type:complete
MTTTKDTLRAEVEAIQERMDRLQKMEEWGYTKRPCGEWCEHRDGIRWENPDAHDWEPAYINEVGDGYIFTRQHCKRCGVTKDNQFVFKSDTMDDDYHEFRIWEKPEDPEPKTSETADKPTLPLEQTSQSDGTYRVDVSEILGQNKEE